MPAACTARPSTEAAATLPLGEAGMARGPGPAAAAARRDPLLPAVPHLTTAPPVHCKGPHHLMGRPLGYFGVTASCPIFAQPMASSKMQTYLLVIHTILSHSFSW
jgi:hypothetical protein